MRILAQDVEYYHLTRESQTTSAERVPDLLDDNTADTVSDKHVGHSLRDALWYFDGTSMRVWPDVLDVVSAAPADQGREIAPALAISLDFYPLTPVIDTGIIVGIEPELVLRRDVDFAFGRLTPRAHLFIPTLLRHQLSNYDSSAALHLSDSYQKLPYFSHALEILLHDVLDEEVDAHDGNSNNNRKPNDTSFLASVLAFLSSYPTYLDIIVQCTRKTELRSWRTLFKHLPAVTNLFEEALRKNDLKTAGGFLLVLHTFDEGNFGTQQIARLMRMAAERGEWELCKEMARFLVGVDGSGEMLRRTLGEAGLRSVGNGAGGSSGGD